MALALKTFIPRLFIVSHYIQYDYIHSIYLCRPTGHEDWLERGIDMLGLHTWVRFSHHMGSNATESSGAGSASINLYLDDLVRTVGLFGVFDYLLDSFEWSHSSKVCDLCAAWKLDNYIILTLSRSFAFYFCICKPQNVKSKVQGELNWLWNQWPFGLYKFSSYCKSSSIEFLSSWATITELGGWSGVLQPWSQLSISLSIVSGFQHVFRFLISSYQRNRNCLEICHADRGVGIFISTMSGIAPKKLSTLSLMPSSTGILSRPLSNGWSRTGVSNITVS